MTTRSRELHRGFAAGWFDAWLRVFVAGIVVSVAVLALGPIPQMKFIGAITGALAIVGTLVCALGVRAYAPARWRELASHVGSVGDSLRSASEAIGEPRSAAYARAVASSSRYPRI